MLWELVTELRLRARVPNLFITSVRRSVRVVPVVVGLEWCCTGNYKRQCTRARVSTSFWVYV